MKTHFIIPLALILIGIEYPSLIQAQTTTKIELTAYKRIDEPARNEVSGIVQSRQYKDTFWVHGDSGTPDKIYAINKLGEIISDNKDYNGTELIGAKNKDWEDISRGEDGTLIVADLGNNCKCRDDLKVFFFDEPNPDDKEVEIREEYDVIYPEKESLIQRLISTGYDTEAIFWMDGALYTLTKEARQTSLFKLENPQKGEINMFTYIRSFETGNYVTAADINKGETLLALLTYDRLWISEIENGNFFTGKNWEIPFSGTEQVESVAFTDTGIIIAEENGDLYLIPFSAMR